MSLNLIQEYHRKVEEIIQYGGSRNETSIRLAFQKLIEQYCSDKKIELIPELAYKTVFGTTVHPDGTLKDALRQDWGYWESKDTYDVLDEEIQKKLLKVIQRLIYFLRTVKLLSFFKRVRKLTESLSMTIMPYML
jgi:hypothetical protein